MFGIRLIYLQTLPNNLRSDIIYYARTFCKNVFCVPNQLNTPLRGVRT